MIYRLRTLGPLTVLLLALAVPANGQGVGFAAGANFTELDDIDTGDRSATLDNVTGWHLHLWFDLPLGPVGLRPGIRYMDAGHLFDPVETTNFEDFVDEQDVTFLEFPIDLRLKLDLPIVSPYVLAGPVLRFATDTNNKDRLEEFSLAGGAGLGLEIGIAGLRFYPEVKYTFGVTSFVKEEYELGNVVIQPDEQQNLNAVMLSFGIGL